MTICCKKNVEFYDKNNARKYFQEFNIKFDPFTDIIFKEVRDSRNAKKTAVYPWKVKDKFVSNK